MEPLRADMDVQEAILARRSVRSYADRKVTPTVIRSLLEAAVRAPTAVHEEPWAFVVIQDHALLRQLSDEAKPLFALEAAHAGLARAGQGRDAFSRPDFNIFHDADALIIICAKPLGPFVAADCWLAAENLMLFACALGLGSCVIGSALPALEIPEIKAQMGIPPDMRAIAPIVVGYPSGETPPSPRREPEVLAWR